MEQTKRDRYLRRLTALKNERSSYDSHWKELADYVLPRSVMFQTSDRNKGGKVNQHIIDSTATLALRTLASGMMAGLTSPARPWFRLTTQDPNLIEDGAVKQWLFDVESRMREVFNRSNLYNVLPKAYQDLGLFGTTAFEVCEDYEDIIRCYPYHIGEFYLANSCRLQVDTCYREIPMTVAQIVGRFGIENVSQTIKEQYDRGNYDQNFDIVHVVEPNPDYDERKALSKFKKYRCVYMEKGNNREDKFLMESGHDEFPVLAARWALPRGDVYGESAAMHTLADIKALQLEQKRKLQAIDKMVNPPMLGDTQLRNQRVSQLPGDVTYVSGLTTAAGAGLRPLYEMNPRVNELMLDIQEIQNRVKRGLYEDLMLMLATGDNSQMTAREVEERHQEKLLVLGPVMERLNDELLDPLIDRTFAIMDRKGLIPPAPDAIQGTDLRVEYISIMAQAQKLIGVSAIERTMGFVGNMAAVRPEILDKIDFDQAVDEYANMQGVPPRMIISDDAVANTRAVRAQQQQAQAMLQVAQPMQHAAQAAKVLSETNVTEESALSQIMGLT